MARKTAAKMDVRYLACSVVSEGRTSGLEEELGVAERLGQGTELGCCAVVRSPRLWPSLFRGDS